MLTVSVYMCVGAVYAAIWIYWCIKVYILGHSSDSSVYVCVYVHIGVEEA